MPIRRGQIWWEYETYLLAYYLKLESNSFKFEKILWSSDFRPSVVNPCHSRRLPFRESDEKTDNSGKFAVSTIFEHPAEWSNRLNGSIAVE